jgi:hypothetical protein
MAANMKMTAVWDIVLCSLVKVERPARDSYCLRHYLDDGVSTHLWSQSGLEKEANLFMEAASSFYKVFSVYAAIDSFF